MNPYVGKILFINLSTGESEVRPLSEETVRAFPGGAALGAKILYDEMPAHTPVFSEDSIIGFVCGALNNSGALMSCRYTVVSKSPVTDAWNDANSGGTFGPKLREAGFDAVFVKGIAKKPVYIFIEDSKVEIRSAEKYWGTTTTVQFEKAVEEELGKKITAASISIGGEKLHRMAAIMNDGHRAAGRGGSGAVMGSKNLKAIVVCGTGKAGAYDRNAVLALNKEAVDWQMNGPVKPVGDMFRNHGTNGAYESSIYTGDIGIKNWAGSHFDCSEAVTKEPSAQEMDKRFKKRKYACHMCSVGCGAIYDLTREGYDDAHAGRPEYETAGEFGSLLLNSDAMSVNICNTLCNEYSYDTISVGGTVAWAMECYDKGILSKDELDGIDLTWGNSEAIVQLTEKICKSEGIGELLAEGSAFAAKTLGKGEECLVVAGGIEIPQHDARYGPSLARTYKFDPTPGRHVKGGLGGTVGARPDEFKHNPSALLAEDIQGTIDTEMRSACGYCIFTDWGYRPGMLLDYLNAASGFNFDQEEFNRTGIRSFMIRQAFNLREGLRREDTTISDRMIGVPPLKEGPLAGVVVKVEEMGDNFFRAIGCDMHGVPYKETLEKLGSMESVIADLYGA